MRNRSGLIAGVLWALATLAVADVAAAQTAPGLGPQRNCQTLTTCQFKRGGSYRGCVSSYSCRTCRFVDTGCRIAGAAGSCRKLKCTWGG